MAYDYRDTVLVAGMGRSGTTWLGDLVNYNKRFQTLFEPLHPENGVDLRRKLYNGLYMRPDKIDQTLKDEVHALLTGQYRNAYVDQYNDGSEGNRLLIKEIRMGLILRWIHVHFPDMPIIYILRHPAAVVSSQMRLGWDMDVQERIQKLVNQTELVEDYLHPFVRVFQRVRNEFEMRTLTWCLTHYILFKQFKPGEIHLVFYEALAQNPLQELQKIFEYLKLPLEETKILPIIDQPSKTTWSKDLPAESSIKQIDKWKEIFTDEQAKFILNALQMFGLEAIYGTRTSPDAQLALAMLDDEQLPMYNQQLVAQSQKSSGFSHFKRLLKSLTR